MNNSRRKRLQHVLELIGQAQEELAAIREEEEDAYYNLPESLQASERGEAMEEAISHMEDADSGLCESADEINEMMI